MKTLFRSVAALSISLILSSTLLGQLTISPQVGIHNSSINEALTKGAMINLQGGVHIGIQADLSKEKTVFYSIGFHAYQFRASFYSSDQPTLLFEEQSNITTFKVPLLIGAHLWRTPSVGLLLKSGLYTTVLQSFTAQPAYGFTAKDIQPLHFGIGTSIELTILEKYILNLTHEKGITNFINGTIGKNNLVSLTAGMVF